MGLRTNRCLFVHRAQQELGRQPGLSQLFLVVLGGERSARRQGCLFVCVQCAFGVLNETQHRFCSPGQVTCADCTVRCCYACVVTGLFLWPPSGHTHLWPPVFRYTVQYPQPVLALTQPVLPTFSRADALPLCVCCTVAAMPVAVHCCSAHQGGSNTFFNCQRNWGQGSEQLSGFPSKLEGRTYKVYMTTMGVLPCFLTLSLSVPLTPRVPLEPSLELACMTTGVVRTFSAASV